MDSRDPICYCNPLEADLKRFLNLNLLFMGPDRASDKSLCNVWETLSSCERGAAGLCTDRVNLQNGCNLCCTNISYIHYHFFELSS